MTSNDDFYSLVRARMAASQGEHSSRVVAAAQASNARRRAKDTARVKRWRGKLSDERKKAISARKMDRAMILHGEDVFVRQGREYRDTPHGMRYVKNYNASEAHAVSAREYINRCKEKDPEGYARTRRECQRRVYAKKKRNSLFLLLVNLPPLPSPKV